MINKVLQTNTERVFVKKDCDRTAPHVQAAIITAAGEMATAANIISKEATIDELINAFGVNSKEEVLNLIGMNSNFVKSAIGYSVEFEDLSRATVAYEADKKTYDDLYKKIEASYKERVALLENNKKQI